MNQEIQSIMKIVKWLNFEWVPNGTRGKVKLHPITKYV